jgi:hypothetical protein
MMIPLIHLGMLIVGVPYSTEGMIHTEARGGTPYGATTISGPKGELAPTAQDLAICGRRESASPNWRRKFVAALFPSNPALTWALTCLNGLGDSRLRRGHTPQVHSPTATLPLQRCRVRQNRTQQKRERCSHRALGNRNESVLSGFATRFHRA